MFAGRLMALTSASNSYQPRLVRVIVLPSTGTGAGDPLDFTVVDSGFDMLWPNNTLPAAVQVAVGDVVVVYNDGTVRGNAYSGVNAVQVASLVQSGGTPFTTAITFVPAGTGVPFDRKQFPSESPGGRFQVVPAGQHVVSYSCDGGALIRSVRTLAAAWPQPATCAAMVAGAASNAPLAG